MLLDNNKIGIIKLYLNAKKVLHFKNGNAPGKCTREAHVHQVWAELSLPLETHREIV